MSAELAALDHCAIGYVPMINLDRAVSAVRFSVFPNRPDGPPQGAAIVDAVQRIFGSGEPGNEGSVPTILLSMTNEQWLVSALKSRPSPNIIIEVPAFMAEHPGWLKPLQQCHAAGLSMAIGGRPITQMPRELIPCFKHAIVAFADERRDSAPKPDTPKRSITTINSGVRTAADIQSAFVRGVEGVLGWPVDDDVTPLPGGKIPADVRSVLELMQRIDREEPPEKLESVLNSDPALAFRLLRYINSAAFGLQVEVTSFRHAVMLLGYQKLKKWLALLLVSGTKEVAQRPVMHIAARRGLLMESLGVATADDEIKGEMFICGVFSLLDRLMHQPLPDLVNSVPIPQRVQQSLLADGPYTQHLNLVRAIEECSPHEIREAAEALMLSMADVNSATLKALANARSLE